MSFKCRSTLVELDTDGFAAGASRRLTGGRRRMPVSVDFTRQDVIQARSASPQRISISGVQDKISVQLQRGTLVVTEQDGEFILKPIPGTPLPRCPDQVPANEHVTMQIAEQVFGIDTAASALIDLADGEPAYLTRRFDRDASGLKLPMEDFCSLAGQSPDTHGRNFKYDGSYEQIGALIKQFCPAYLVEVEKLFQRLLFTYLTGNGDAHLKNFSVIATSDGDHVLTPAYDLLNTTLHLPHESPLALDLFADGHETASFTANGFYTATDFIALGDRFGIAARRRDRIQAPFSDEAHFERLRDLVQRSFLNPEARDLYLRICADRRRALLVQ